MLYQLSYCPLLAALTASQSLQNGIRAYHRPGRARLAGLLMERVATIEAAELLHLDTLAVIDLVLGRDVVPTLAVLALKRDLDPLLVLRHFGLLASSYSTLTGIPARLVAEAGLEPATPRL